MSWRVELQRKAERDLSQLPGDVLSRLTGRLQTLECNPFPFGAKRLQGQTYYGLVVDDYRIVYEVKREQHVIMVHSVGHRREAHRR